MNEAKLNEYLDKVFGVDIDMFYLALQASASARGYIHGAISEVLLTNYLEEKEFEFIRIKEKPSGGFNAKSSEARGDFYFREKDSDNDWFVIECKGLKTNSEFRGKIMDKAKVLKYLKALSFPAIDYKETIYKKGLKRYDNAKIKWERKNSGKSFPPFRWSKDFPGPIACVLSGIWKNEGELKDWVELFPDEKFTEEAYRNCQGTIRILETHKPSKRVAPITDINRAAPLVTDFNILAVDLYLRTGIHEFVFMNPEKISHSPSSPEHLYQNYTIDVLVEGKKPNKNIVAPWYVDIQECIENTAPQRRQLDETQIDSR